MELLDTRDPDYDPLRIGSEISRMRAEAGLTQRDLARRCRTTQQQISNIEAALRPPQFNLLLKIARALDMPLQRLISGDDRPGTGVKGLAVELRRLGLTDLHVPVATIPGSSRHPEEVISLAIAGPTPDPRIIAAIPALLAWNNLDARLLTAHATWAGTARRLAWLADATLSIERHMGFPGGCFGVNLGSYIEGTSRPGPAEAFDGMGAPSEHSPKSPIWRRWKISYDATLEQFIERAKVLLALREPRRPSRRRILIARSLAIPPPPDMGLPVPPPPDMGLPIPPAPDMGLPIPPPPSGETARKMQPKLDTSSRKPPAPRRILLSPALSTARRRDRLARRLLELKVIKGRPQGAGNSSETTRRKPGQRSGGTSDAD